MPRVSVIIPTYNLAHLLGQTIESVLNQAYLDLEIIVVDDGSTDATSALMENYAGRLIYLRHANQGVAAARNHGFQCSSGEYICFLDHDDLLLPGKFESQVARLQTEPALGLVYSGWQYIDGSNGQILREMRPNREGHLLKDLLHRRLFIVPGAALVRRFCLEKVGLFDIAIPAAGDTDLWLRIAGAGYPFGYVDQLSFQYRQIRGSMSGQIRTHARHEFAALDKFFSDQTLPDDIKTMKAEAYSILHYDFGARFYAAGDFDTGKEHFRQAIVGCPTLSADREWLLEWLGGYALGLYFADSHQKLDELFDNLPDEAVILRTLRRRAFGRYHVAAAFSEHQNRRPKNIRQHILPALLGEPKIIWNRGFLSIALKSLLH